MADSEFLIGIAPEEPQTDTEISIGLPETKPEALMTPNIGVIGVGGAGGNAVNNMIESHLQGVSFIVANTDAQVMSRSLTQQKIQLGVSLTQGLGSGSDPAIGKAAAEESADKIKEAIKDFHLLFIAAGMGGGTGTGASPVIAKLAKEMGINTIGVVTKPFRMEGPLRTKIAEAGIKELEQYVDSLIIVPNQNLFKIAKATTKITEAFKIADDVLYQGIKSVTDFILTPMLVNLDFADLRSIISIKGRAMMGAGEAEGEDRALIATEKAISNPLLGISIQGAKGLLINISGNDQLRLEEVDCASERLQQEVGDETRVVVGTNIDNTLGNKIRVSIVATGLDAGGDQIIPTKTPETLKALETQPEPIIVTPVVVPTDESADDEALASDDDSLAESVKTTLQSAAENTFIPEAPLVDTKQPEEKESDDLFGDLLGQATGALKPEEEKAEPESKQKTDFDGIIFPNLFNNESLKKKEGERLGVGLSIKETFSQGHEIPELPKDEVLNIPAFLRRDKA